MYLNKIEKKLDKKSRLGIFMNCCNEKNGYRIWSTYKKLILCGRNLYLEKKLS